MAIVLSFSLSLSISFTSIAPPFYPSLTFYPSLRFSVCNYFLLFLPPTIAPTFILARFRLLSVAFTLLGSFSFYRSLSAFISITFYLNRYLSLRFDFSPLITLTLFGAPSLTLAFTFFLLFLSLTLALLSSFYFSLLSHLLGLLSCTLSLSFYLSACHPRFLSYPLLFPLALDRRKLPFIFDRWKIIIIIFCRFLWSAEERLVFQSRFKYK